MSRLIRANFARLWKSRIFWVGIAYSLGLGLLIVSTQYREMVTTPGYHPHIDNVLFSGGMFMPIVVAVFVGLFVGTEYSDGTIRNKLMVGHTRGAVYASNFLVCTAAVWIMHLATIAVIVGIGFPLVGNLEMPVRALLILGLISMVTVAALSSVFLLVSMLIPSKASSSVAALLLAIAFLMGAMMIDSRLQDPEYYNAYNSSVFMESTGEQGEKIKNPNYLSGTKREIYEFLYDFLPGCQMVQIAMQSPAHMERLPLYSLSILVGTSACGVLFFRRKNIK